ncbi:MAG: LON peptidase substrate-binding domain-containing protein [Rudaea sp.]
MSSDIPLFPLNCVLFPGGALSLRIFERRYLDMVRDCARQNSCFGVCMILHVGEGEGEGEGGEAAAPAAVGTLARIVDFYTTDDGLLGIGLEGDERFRVIRSRVRDNGLAHAQVHLWPPEPSVDMPPEFDLLATILERLLERMGGAYARAERARFDDASWVSFRLAETLPLENRERQHLLQMTDPLERLRQLLHYLPRFQQV